MMTQQEQQHHEKAVSFLEQCGGYIASALRFWEPMRIVYNFALALVVYGHFLASTPESWNALTVDWGLGLFFMAVLANIVYCAAYPIDLFVQLSGLKVQWKWGRVFVLVAGTLFGCVIAHFVAMGMFDDLP